MSRLRCDTCRWWQPSSKPGDENRGQCRIAPPVVHVRRRMVDTPRPYSDAVRDVYLTLWPETRRDKWCGAHAPAERRNE